MCAEEKLLSTSDSHAQYGSARRPSVENKINATIANTSVFIEHGIVVHRRHHVSRRRSRIHLLRHDGFRQFFWPNNSRVTFSRKNACSSSSSSSSSSTKSPACNLLLRGLVDRSASKASLLCIFSRSLSSFSAIVLLKKVV